MPRSAIKVSKIAQHLRSYLSPKLQSKAFAASSLYSASYLNLWSRSYLPTLWESLVPPIVDLLVSEEIGVVDGKAAGDEGVRLNGDPVLRKSLELASQELLRDASQSKDGPQSRLSSESAAMKAITDEIARQQGYKEAVKSEPDAEINWNRALPKGEKSLTAAVLKEKLQNPDLDPRSRGFLQFIDDNFAKIAGTANIRDGQNAQVTIADVCAIGGMNQIAPERIAAGTKFLKDNFFQVSGMDDKVTAQRVERLLFDHSFQLFPKETQERLFDLTSVVKSADQRLANFEQGKRSKSGLSEDDAKKLDATELSDNLRVQALQKSLYGTKVQRLDGKQLGSDAKSQYEAASKRYKELQQKGLDSFLEGLDR